MVPLALLVLLLIDWSKATYPDESYQLTDNDNNYIYPDEILDENDFETRKRSSSNFLRFGRGGNDYEDYAEDFARPTRSGKVEKNDHFIRFGRSKQDFLRFGRSDPHRVPRANHLRFGRSIEMENKMRTKGDVNSGEYKRAGGNFLRFGRRNSNFMRFGRNNELSNVPATTDYDNLHKQASEILENLKQYPNSQLANLLMEFLEHIRRNNDV